VTFIIKSQVNFIVIRNMWRRSLSKIVKKNNNPKEPVYSFNEKSLYCAEKTSQFRGGEAKKIHFRRFVSRHNCLDLTTHAQ